MRKSVLSLSDKKTTERQASPFRGGDHGSAHILFLVLVFILASVFWFVRNQSVGFPNFKLSEFKKEKQPSAEGVIFSEKQEPAVEQAERYYKDHNVHTRRGH